MTADLFRLFLAASLALGLVTAALVTIGSPWSWVLLSASVPWGASLVFVLRSADKRAAS